MILSSLRREGMKVFISWSGEQSKQIAKVFEEYISVIVPNCEIFFSPKITKGTRWFDEIGKELESSDVGLFCITQENLTKPWILFEAGALSLTRGLDKSRVCLFLFNVKGSELPGPLTHFQITSNNKEDIFQLYESINQCFETPLEPTRLIRLFNKFWEEMEIKLNNIPNKKTEKGKKEDTIDKESDLNKMNDTMEEILEIVRANRYKSSTDSPNKITRIYDLYKGVDPQFVIKSLYKCIPEKLQKLTEMNFNEDYTKLQIIFNYIPSTSLIKEINLTIEIINLDDI